MGLFSSRLLGWTPNAWTTLKEWLEFQNNLAHDMVLSMSILERLMTGVGLGFFSLATLYVLLFRSSVSKTMPRILLRLILILTVATTSTLSYFTLARSLVTQTDRIQAVPTTVGNTSEHSVRIKGRVDGIRDLEKQREKKIDEMTGP